MSSTTIDTLVTIQGSSSMSALQMNLPLDQPWGHFQAQVSSASGLDMPFVVSVINDTDDDSVIANASDWEILKAKTVSLSSVSQLVLSVSPAPEPPVDVPIDETANTDSRNDRRSNCRRGRNPFAMMGGLFNVQELMQNAGIEQGDVEGLIHSFMKGQPLPEEKADKLANAVALLSNQDKNQVKGHMSKAFKCGQEVMSAAKVEMEKFASQSAPSATPVPSDKKEDTPEKANDAEKTVSPKVRHNAACDICQEHITGIRYKCVNCLDYDMCEPCEGKNVTEGLHPATHVFAKVYNRLPASDFSPLKNLYVHNHRSRCNAPPSANTAQQPSAEVKQASRVAHWRKFQDARIAAQKTRNAAMKAEADTKAETDAKAEADNKAAATSDATVNEAKQLPRDSRDSKLSALERQLEMLTRAIAEERASRNA